MQLIFFISIFLTTVFADSQYHVHVNVGSGNQHITGENGAKGSEDEGVNINNSGGLCTKRFQSNYYWKDWEGSMPYDAYVAEERSSDKLFIGQAYFPKYPGLLSDVMRSCDKQLYAPWGNSSTSPGRSSLSLKILCSSKPTKLYWLTTNYKTLEQDIANKKAVIGGQSYRNPDSSIPNYIGRAFYRGEYYYGFIEGTILYTIWENTNLSGFFDYTVLVEK